MSARPEPQVYTTYTPINDIRALKNIELHPISAYTSPGNRKQRTLRAVAESSREHLLDIMSMLRRDSVHPASARIQSAMVHTACRPDPYAPPVPSVDLPFLLETLYSTWEKNPPPDIVFMLGPQSSSTLPGSQSVQALAVLASSILSEYQESTWCGDWENPKLLNDNCTVSFHVRTQLGRRLIFISGVFAGCSFWAGKDDLEAVEVLREYLKLVLFNETVHVTRSEIFGIENALTSPCPNTTTDPDAPSLEFGEAGLQAEHLAFGTTIGLYVSEITLEGESLFSIRGCYQHLGSKRTIGMSTKRLRKLFDDPTTPWLPLPQPPTPAAASPSPHISRHVRPRYLTPISVRLSLHEQTEVGKAAESDLLIQRAVFIGNGGDIYPTRGS
ncbi:hypothetical protein DFH09DRAFT_1135370 [Mycena vulgaris]|nr:hypothetical protein DFH09DRAFT_1135370 [Mycena vulgaris]